MDETGRNKGQGQHPIDLSPEPLTEAEWQTMVNRAFAALALDDLIRQGLSDAEGGAWVDVQRARDLLERGRARGVSPSEELTAAAIQ